MTEQTLDHFDLEHSAMQAPPSFPASAEHLVSGLSSLPLALPFAPPTSAIKPFGAPEVAREVADGVGLAHDAGNLLGAIRLYCDLLALPGVLRSEHRHYADELRALTARSGTLIDRLLRPGFAADSTAKEDSRAERVCLADAVLACRGMLEPVVGAGSLLIAVEAGARSGVAVPREALERILLNLIKNAVEARDGDEGRGAVAVRVRAERAWGPEEVDGVALSVEDRGRGMDEPALRDALAGKADEKRPGRGIGLRVVRELVARTGGELRMRSRVGQGTTVEIVWAALPEDGAGSG